MIGAKGGGGSFTQKPDNLRSNDTFEGLLGLCVGPIKGPVRGLKSIRLNGTPIEGEDGTLNFPEFTALFADGDPLKFPQKAELRLGAGGSPDQIGANVRNDPSAGGNPWITHTLNNTGANSIDLRFIVQNLYRQTAKGIYEETMDLEVQMKPVGTSTWINPFGANGNAIPPYQERGYETDGFLRLLVSKVIHTANVNRYQNGAGQYLTIRGKTTSPYVHELRIQVPNAGIYANKAWDVRVRLLQRESYDSPEGTEDKNRITERRLVQWESMTAVYNGALGDHEDWRGLAWLQLHGKASDNFAGLPEVDGIYDTKIVSVPPLGVYNPETRTYTAAIWDGSWAKAYCNDPAWVISDAISDNLSGIAAFVPGARLNKWDALELSKWASEQVPDGYGDTHPRYSMNLFVDQPQKADEFIRYLAGAVGATAWDNGDGEWRLKVDKPEAPSNIFTHENIEGEFLYSHTDVDTRFNDVTVVFLNEEFDFREDRVRVQNFADIELNGRKPTRVVAIGCTNRQQALRLAILRLRTNLNEKRMVTFRTNRQGKHLERFDHILIADGSLDSHRTTGRVILKSNDGLSVTVRDPVRLEQGATYQLHFTIPNPGYDPAPDGEPEDPTWDQPTITVVRQITNGTSQRGDVTQLHLDQPVPADMPENAVVALGALGMPTLPKIFRVLDVGYDDNGEAVSVNAMEVDTGKWAAADNATETQLEIEKPVYQIPVPKAPVDGSMFHLDSYVTDGGVRRVLTVRWERPVGRYTTTYNVRYRVNQGSWRLLDETADTSIELHYPDAGVYDFEITANDRRGRVSQPLTGNYELEDGVEIPPAAGLTNEAALVYADHEGNVTDFSEAVGSFFLTNSVGIIGADVEYYVKPGSATGGLAATIDMNGNYAATGLTTNNGSVTLVAEWNDFVFEKVFSVAKSLAGAPGEDGLPGAAAKGIAVNADILTVPFNADATPVNAGAVVTFRAERKNTTAAVAWAMTKLDGTVVSGGVTLAVAGDGLSATLSHGSFNTARGAGEGIVVTTTCDGFTDRVSVVRTQAGAKGDKGEDGTSSYAVLDSNPTHILPADAAGNVTSYNGASTSFQILYQGADVSSSFTLSVVSNPQALVHAINGKTVTVTGGLDAGEPNGILGLRLTGSGSFAGTVLDRQFNITKSRAGADGSPAPLITIQADKLMAKYDAGDSYVGGAITFTQTRVNVNPPLVPQFTLVRGDTGAPFSGPGTAASFAADATRYSSTAPEKLTMTAARVAELIALYGSFQVVASASSVPVTDSVSIVKVKDGSSGAPGTNVASPVLYQRTWTATPPALPAVALTYNFVNGQLTGQLNGWAQAMPADGGPYRWQTTATALSTTGTDSIPPSEWAPAALMGNTANAGKPIGLTTNARFDENMEGWFDTHTNPTTGPSRGVRNVDFQGAAGVWRNNAGTYSYIYSALIPVDPSRKYRIRGRVWSSGHGGTLYVGATSHDALGATIGTNAGHNYIQGVGSGSVVPGGWHDIASQVLTGEGATVDQAAWFRAGTKQIRVLAFLNYSQTANQEFGLDSLWIEDVTDVLRTERVYLYKRAVNPGPPPSTTSTYDFASGALTGHNNGWSQARTASNGEPLWMTVATVSNLNPTAQIAPGQWASPIIDVQDGAKGDKGVKGDNAYTHFAYADSADGSLNFTTGAPAGRAFRGEYSDNVEADSSNPAAYTWAPYTGPAAFGLANIGSIALGPDWIEKVANSGGWNASGYSTESLTGGCMAQVTAHSQAYASMFGLTKDGVSNSSYETIDYAFYQNAAGNLHAYEKGTGYSLGVTHAEGDVLQVVYDGVSVSYIRNGKILRRVTDGVPANATFFFDSSIYHVGARLKNIKWTSHGARGAGTFTLVPHTGVLVGADWIEKNAGSGDWNASGHSAEGYVGGCSLSFQLPDAAAYVMGGINTDPSTNASYASIDYAFYATGGVGSRVYCYENLPTGAQYDTNVNHHPSNVYQIHYDGKVVRYLINGSVVRTTPTAPGQRFFFDSSIVVLGQKITNIKWTAAGAAGDSPYTLILTNDNMTFPADNAGNVVSYGNGYFGVQVLLGSTDVTSSFAASVPSNPQGLSVTGNYPNYQVSGGLDAGEDSAQLTLRVTGQSGIHANQQLDKVITVSKSKGGASAPLIALSATKLTANYDKTGAYVGGPITFRPQRTNIPDSANWAYRIIRVSDGVLLNATTAAGYAAYPTYWSSSDGRELTWTAGGVHAYIAAYGAFRVEAYSDGYAVTDSITIVKVQDGADGLSAASMDPQYGSQTVEFAYTGVAKASQLPRTNKFTMRLGETDVSASTAWTIIDYGGVDGVSISSAGLFTFTGCSGSGFYKVRGVYAGASIEKTVQVVRQVDNPPPPEVPSGGGGTGASSASFSIGTAPSVTTFPTTPGQFVTIQTNASGQVRGQLAVQYWSEMPSYEEVGARSYTAKGKLVYRVAGSGGAWNDFSGGAVTGTQAVSRRFPNGEDTMGTGVLNIDQTQGGLTANAAYEVSVILAKAGGTAGFPDLYGTFTGSKP